KWVRSRESCGCNLSTGSGQNWVLRWSLWDTRSVMATAHTKTPTAGPGPAFAAGQRGTGDQGAYDPVPSQNALRLPPRQIGNFGIDVPDVLAPMAGMTNTAFRRVCREYGGGLYVAEMVAARALVERHPESMRIIDHDDDEVPRSV